ncbi:MAG TPA: hypothetical protein VLH18_08265 [Candidatus Limnocylindrales bacterium]|nr:hypothetical protein [Candidatus Limnocylindrales bacterium]
MGHGVSVIVFEGAEPKSNVEEMMVRVRQAALLDNLNKLAMVPQVEAIYLHTNRQELVAPARCAGAEVVINSIAPESFHFGRELQKIISNRNIQRAICFNGAGCPLITVHELEMICQKLLSRKHFVYTNNTQSADIVAFTVPDALNEVALPAIDNSLAMTLRDHLGMEMELMPHSLGLLFDIDTPTDVLVLGSGPFAGPHAKAVLSSLQLDYRLLDRAKAVLGDEYQDVALVGRVGAPIIERLNSVLKLRLRVFSEERGMKALGRIESKEVISLLGLLLDHVGPELFFSYLAQVASCAFIDSRVLMCHYRFDIPDQDRFMSDLGMWQHIEHQWLREFTKFAVQCAIPVVLGGHSLVSGSLWALSCELDPAVTIVSDLV